MIKSGTIEEHSNFDGEVDACRIRIALKGQLDVEVGSERYVSQIITSRHNTQRQDIDKHYKNLFKVSVCEDIATYIGKGSFYEVCWALMAPPALYDANSLREAIMEGRDQVISEILCTRTYTELEAIKEVYQSEFEASIGEDIDNFITGEVAVFYKQIIDTVRGSVEDVDEEITRQATECLIKAEENSWRDSKEYMSTLTSHNFAQLRLVFCEFTKRPGGNMELLEGSIRKKCPNAVLKETLAMWIKSVKNSTQLLSEILYASVTALTADIPKVIRIVVGRSEIDLTQIKSHYMMQYNKTLKLAVQQKSGGDNAYSDIMAMVIKN